MLIQINIYQQDECVTAAKIYWFLRQAAWILSGPFFQEEETVSVIKIGRN